MKAIWKRIWPVLAVAAGVVLVWFEVRRSGGVNMDNWFWVLIGGVIILLGALNLLGVGKGLEMPRKEDEGPRDLGL